MMLSALSTMTPPNRAYSIHDIPVLGTVEQLPEICKEKNIEEIAIAMPSATVPQRRRVVQVCQGTKVRFQDRAVDDGYRLGQIQSFANTRRGY